MSPARDPIEERRDSGATVKVVWDPPHRCGGVPNPGITTRAKVSGQGTSWLGNLSAAYLRCDTTVTAEPLSWRNGLTGQRAAAAA